MSSPTTTPTPQASRNSSTIQFGNFVTEHELLSRTIPSLFSSVRPPTVLTSAATPTPTWHHIPPPQPNRGAPRLSLGSVQVSRNEWSAGDTVTSLRGWHTPFAAPAFVYSFAHAVRIAERRARSAASSSSSQSQSGDVPPRGLQNVANDCFANSVLQLLVHCAPLRDWFERLLVVIGDLESRDHKARVDVPQLVRVFAQLVHDYRHGIGQDDTLVSPWSPFAKPQPPLKLATRVVSTVMPGRKTVVEQQDAQEFLVLLLDSLHGALLDSQSAEQDDPASNVYYFSDPEDDGGDSATSARANGKAASRSSESSAGRANGHASTSSDGGASEEWTEIGPASRKSVVITTDKTWRDSPVSHVLRGRLRSTIKRRNAKSSISIEPFFSLSLDPLLGVTGAASAGGASALPDKRRPGGEAPSTTLPLLLKAFLASERVADSGTARANEKHTQLEIVPPTLLVHIARFTFVNGVVRKLDANVAFATQLELPTDLFAVHAAPAAPLLYRLTGVVRHHGAAATSGHYTACVLVQKPATKGAAASNSWFLCDDTHVDPITEDAVLASKDTAYLLMYTRV